MAGLIGINVSLDRRGHVGSEPMKDPIMTSDTIELWAAMLGFAYIAGAGIYFQLTLAKKHSPVSASYRIGRRPPPRSAKAKR
ncbi:hypothetical protein FJ930_11615 [Mesorhizobium sp. B2-4-15]|uniref:hypothetical protein n=1 Tax=Mesorhizobium sp. B2-4-15 TaxID=2589934 RepID=UPI0011528A0B|nr:hypothetical protein [Mesorhizobium sp. B2-4-15]TPK72407.1 hypothetical protein FJ930_11615 [Mesorhizobium sp. B2-4-15]